MADVISKIVHRPNKTLVENTYSGIETVFVIMLSNKHVNILFSKYIA